MSATCLALETSLNYMEIYGVQLHPAQPLRHIPYVALLWALKRRAGSEYPCLIPNITHIRVLSMARIQKAQHSALQCSSMTAVYIVFVVWNGIDAPCLANPGRHDPLAVDGHQNILERPWQRSSPKK
jgi:hypothetical protein